MAAILRANVRRAISGFFHLVIVTPLQTTNLLRFFRTLQLSVDKAVLRLVAGLDAQPTVSPELSLAAETVRRLHGDFGYLRVSEKILGRNAEALPTH